MSDALQPAWKYPKPVIGLLGAPGSGKSTIARAFEALGCVVVDADAIALAQYADPEVRETIRRWWGGGVFLEDGRIDRRAIGRKVFREATERERLEQLIHPRVHAERERQRQEAFADPDVVAVIEDCPLLLETQLDESCDLLVYIDVPEAIRDARLADTRGWSSEEARRREAAQTPLDTKRERADYVINNAGEPGESALAVQALLPRMLNDR